MLYCSGKAGVCQVAERKITPQERYQKTHSIGFAMRLWKNTEADIIERLDSVPNKAAYIKNLIRKDIAAGKEK